MKELLREKGFLAAMVVSFLGFAMGFPFYQVEFPLGSGSFIQFYQASLESQVMLFLIPIAAVLPPEALCAGICQWIFKIIPFQG